MMRIDLLISGIILFVIGVILIHLFAAMTDYITTIYPLSGYVGISSSTIGILLIYEGIFRGGRRRSRGAIK